MNGVRKMNVALLWMAFIFAPMQIWAGDESYEAEAAKIHTADPNPVDKGSLEWFVGYESARAEKVWDGKGVEADRGGRQKDAETLLGLTLGLGRNLDIGFSTGFEDCRDESCDVTARGHMDLGVASKWKFSSPSKNLSMALLPSFTLPTGNRDSGEIPGVSQVCFSAGLGFVAARSFQKATINFDLGYGLPFGADRGDARGSFNGDLALGWQPFRNIQVESELNFTSDSMEGSDGPRMLAATFGILVPTDKAGRLQLAVQPALSGRLTDKATSFHVAWVY